MWITLVLMALPASLEPVRIAMTVLMINRPRPVLQLLAFLTGGFVMGMTVGAVVVFVLRPVVIPTNLTLPKVQIVIGTLLLVGAVVVATDLIGRVRGRFGGSDGRAGGVLGPLGARGRRIVEGRSLWAAGAAGLGVAVPSVEYLAALALIVASRSATSVQIAGLILFNVVAFLLVEIPLFSYLIAPDRTRAALHALYSWLRARRRVEIIATLTVVGGLLLGMGIAEL
jgi:hypothetical protein